MATVSAWSKAGAWALESEEQDNADKGYASSTDSHHSATAPTANADFPSLSAAATAKTSKKKSKKQTLSLAEFTTTKFQDEPAVVLPSGPRERSAEELDRSRFGGGFRYNSYNSDGGGRARGSDESRRERREPRVLDSGPSRADEVDDWGATKKSVGFGGFSERRERGSFGSSQSKADESDSWISSKKSFTTERRGYDFNREGSNGVGADSESWGRKREENGGRGVDGDNWERRREENGGSGRPRLVLQPRTLPLANGNNGEGEKKGGEVVKSGGGRGGNPFGEARPREEVLKEKGLDWKEIDEKLEVVRIKPSEPVVRKGNVVKEDWTEKAWRRPEMPSRY